MSKMVYFFRLEWLGVEDSRPFFMMLEIKGDSNGSYLGRINKSF